MKIRISAVGVFSLGLFTAGAASPTPSLRIGQPAPKLQVAKWVQGEPVTKFEKGRAYIVEFWATWCGPCRVSIPHLNELAVKFKDSNLTVIGQDCWEKDESLVEPFVKKMGDQMTYRVALDDKSRSKNGAMADTWMMAAGQGGIPCAFLVDTMGTIAWIGHPMQLKEQTIKAVLEGRYDVKKAAADYALRTQNEAVLRTVYGELARDILKKDWDKAEARLEEAAKLMPEEDRGSLDKARLQILFGKEDYAGAYKLVNKMSLANKDDALAQNELAWRILTDRQIKTRDLDLAETIALRANEASGGKNPGVLDTLARAYFMNGKKEQAIATQEKACQLGDGQLKDSLTATLESYKKGKLPE